MVGSANTEQHIICPSALNFIFFLSKIQPTHQLPCSPDFMNQIFQAKRCYLIGAAKFYWIFHSFGREATGEHLQYARTSYKLYQIFSDHSHWHWRKKPLKLYLVIKLLNWFDFKDWLLPHRQKAPKTLCRAPYMFQFIWKFNTKVKLSWI